MSNQDGIKGELEQLMANTYVTLMLTQKAHWHVEGKEFYAIHLMTEAQYDEMQKAIDDIAEHMRAKGLEVPSGMQQYASLSSIVLEPETMISTETMLAHIIDAHSKVLENLEKLRGVASENNDAASEDLAVERIRVHNHHVWMLKSSR